MLKIIGYALKSSDTGPANIPVNLILAEIAHQLDRIADALARADDTLDLDDKQRGKGR